MDEIVPESGARFESMMREIDAGFVKNGVAIPARPLKALMAVGSRYKITMPLTKPFPGAPPELLRYAQLSESIHEWFERLYGDRLKIDFSVGQMVVLIDGDLYALRFPRIYGQVQFVLSRQFMSAPNISSGGPVICNILQLVTGLTPAKAATLTDDELTSLGSNFDLGLRALNVLEASQQMRDRKLDPHTFSLGASRDADFVKRASFEIPIFIEALADFWTTAADATHYQIQDIQSNKGVFGGDLFPTYENNIASSAGLYLDTIVLADPFLRSKEVFKNASPEEAIRYMFKHGLSVLGYKELALANVDPPIVVIAPNQSSLDDRERDFLLRIGNEDALKHANATFFPQFGSPEELIEFGKSLDTVEKVVKELRDPTRLLFDTEWTGSPADQIERALKHRSNFVGIQSPGIMAVGTCFGRMTQATDVLFESRFLGGTPLIQAETSWRYLTWKLEYNASTDTERHTMLAIKGLQHAQENDMEWLGNIPQQALIEMRRTGALDEVRAILFKGLDEVASATPMNFFRTSDKIVANIQEAFQKHQENVRAIKAKGVKFFGGDIGSWIAMGSLELAAIVTGTPTFGAAAFAANQVIDAPKLKEIPDRFRTLRNAYRDLKRAPMSLLFKHRRP